MTRTSIIIALVATFLIGVSLGLMSGILFATYQPQVRRLVWAGAGPRMGAPRMPGLSGGGDPDRRALRERQVLPHLRSELDLTDEQEARIRVLLDEAHASMGSARDSLRVRIERVLTPEQRERWSRLEARHRYPGPSGAPAGRNPGRRPGAKKNDVTRCTLPAPSREPRGEGDRAHRAQPGVEGEAR